MAHIAAQLLNDSRSGLQTDATGRRYFRQRRVAFRTIGMEPGDLYEGDWPGFDQGLAPLDWVRWPTHAELREYSRLSSDRFLAFWYRVLDVSVARALAGRGREIFRTDFFRPSSLLDLGIPAEQTYSTVPAVLHEKIMREYRASREQPGVLRVYYLSDYLTGLTDDVREALLPYARLWDLEARRREIQGRLGDVRARQKAVWAAFARGDETLHEGILRQLDRYLLRFLGEVPRPVVRSLDSETLRHLCYRIQSGQETALTHQDRTEILRHRVVLGLRPAAEDLHRTASMPGRFFGLVQSALVQDAAAYRLDLRMARLQYLYRQHGLESATESVLKRLQAHRRSFRERILLLQREFLEEQSGALYLRRLRILERFAAGSRDEPASGPEDRLLQAWERAATEAGTYAGEEPEAVGAERAIVQESFELLLRLRATESEIIKIHHDFAHATPVRRTEAGDETPGNTSDENTPEAEGELRITSGDARYQGQEYFTLAPDLSIGNPFHEFRILQQARELLLRRLRPVRRTTSFYSLNPGHRHGAMTLNPIMKLWKDRPNAISGENPRLTGLEINTRQTVECLVRLAELVDPELRSREIERYKIAKEKRGREDLGNLSFFLLPGSAFPLREIHRLDFPEFRGRVIGESRSPAELGVPPEEDAVLTGAWYQKNNHALYYPVGGDNGSLVRLIYQSGHSPGPPAFYFALGQMVHDSMPENLIYFRSGEVTFRECIENYYLMEDRIRKNRGEKTGRRRLDNSRPAVRFMFAVCYARLVLEALTGSSQSHFRHRPTERWLARHIGIPLLNEADRTRLKELRARARALIKEYD